MNLASKKIEIRKNKSNKQLCYMDTDSLTYHRKTNDTYEEVAKDVAIRFAVWINEKMFGLMKKGLGGKIIKGFLVLKSNIYAYLKDDGGLEKKAEGAKKC